MGTTVGKNAKGYNYTYTDLAQIHAEMEAQNLRYRQRVRQIDGQDYIETQVYTAGEAAGDWLLGCKIVSAPLSGKSNAAQEQGSAITYARRYSLLMALGWATTDDDAEILTPASPPPTPPKQESKKPPEKKPPTRAQVTMQHARDAGLDKDSVSQLIKASYGRSKVDDLTQDEYEDLLTIIDSHKEGTAA